MRYPARHFWAMVASLLLWGFSFPALKIALRTNSPISILFWRYGFAFVIISIYLAWHRREEIRPIMGRKELFLLGVFNWAGSLLQFAGLAYTTGVHSVILTQMMIVAVPILAFWLLKERLTLLKAVAIVISLSGAVVLSTNLDFRGLAGGSTLKGDGLTVAAVLFWSLYVVYTRRFVQYSTNLQLLSANYTGTFVLAAITALGWQKIAIDGVGLLVCLFLTLFCTILPASLYNYAMKEIDATSSSVIGPLEAVSGVLISCWLLREKLTIPGMAGALLIIGSSYLVVLPIGKKR